MNILPGYLLGFGLACIAMFLLVSYHQRKPPRTLKAQEQRAKHSVVPQLVYAFMLFLGLAGANLVLDTTNLVKGLLLLGLGAIFGISYSKRINPSWAIYVKRSIKETTQMETTEGLFKYFLLTIAGVLGWSLVINFLDRIIVQLTLLFLMGGFVGYFGSLYGCT